MIYSGGEQEYLAYQYRKPRELISFVFVIIVGMFGKGSGLAQVNIPSMNLTMFA